MRTLHSSEKQRIILSVFIAFAVHIVLFLIFEYGNFIKLGEPAEYVGPMIVEISEVTTIPETKEAADSEPEVTEEPVVEEPEAEPTEPEYEEEPTTEPIQEKTTEREEQTESSTDVPTTDESATEETTPERDESYTVPTPPRPEPEDQPDQYNGTDQGNEFQIKLGSLAISPQPNIGPSIAAELPSNLSSMFTRKTEVTFSFIIGPDGMITHIYKEKSSGNERIDRIIRDTLLRWKFSRPVRQERVEGEFTYIIKP